MEPNEQNFQDMFNRYLRGTVTEEEKVRISRWLSQLDALDEPLTVEQLHAKKVLSQQELRQQFSHKKPVVLRKIGIAPLSRWLVAASVTIAVIISSILFWPKLLQTDSPLAYEVISTGRGEVKTATLPDGTKITLNHHSSVRFPKKFSQSTRSVLLTGEAFFTVIHQADRPFVVQAGNIRTRVYGTEFNITAYPQATDVRIALKKGSIGVWEPNHSEKKLVPGQQFIHGTTTNASRVLAADTKDIGAWMTGRWVFTQQPLKDVLSALENRYGMHYVFPASLGEKIITAKFDNVPLETILAHLSFGWDFQLKRSGDTIYLQQAIHTTP
jgi:ferric-dicitrate binding protein FerR (iron transport regulator)